MRVLHRLAEPAVFSFGDGNQDLKKVVKSEWSCFADIKKTFNSVDNVGNQRYVFNIKGTDFCLVSVIKFTIRFVYIRSIGTYKEYDRIDCRNI